MVIKLVDEFNGDGHLMWVDNFPGAYVRGRTLDEALAKLPTELSGYCKWAQINCTDTNF